LIIERDYGFNIWAYTRVDTVRPEYLDKLKSAGVNWLAIGIEAGNQSIRQEITKGKFQDINIRDVVHSIQEAGINVCANYIYGLGHDNWDTMQETLNLALELNAENSNMYGATSLPGSPLYMKAKQEGWELPQKYSEFGFLSYDHIPTRTYSLEPREVLEFRDYAFHVCFENPRYLNMIQNKFGSKAVEHIKEMTSVKIKRKLLGDHNG
jgi:anaerobic magnesium-protoporphyrin IX monomethyl ester cyclase